MRGYELLKVDSVVGTGNAEQLHIVRGRAGIQNAVEDGADEQQAKRVEQADRGHKNHG